MGVSVFYIRFVNWCARILLINKKCFNLKRAHVTFMGVRGQLETGNNSNPLLPPPSAHSVLFSACFIFQVFVFLIYFIFLIIFLIILCAVYQFFVSSFSFITIFHTKYCFLPVCFSMLYGESPRKPVKKWGHSCTIELSLPYSVKQGNKVPHVSVRPRRGDVPGHTASTARTATRQRYTD